jgi:GT2 family glycosyltransferase/tetratricopeptide (TPR) repeat protein/SAM-dependent methyltransferase
MTIRNVCVIYDDRDRPETTGGYCLRAMGELTTAVHVLPSQLKQINPGEFDLFVRIDDGLDYSLQPALHPLIWWAIDTHLSFDRCRKQAMSANLTFAAQKPGVGLLRQAGITLVEWLPLGCDPVMHRPHDVPKRYDVCFVGNLFPGARIELIEMLRREFPNHFVGRAYFDDMARVYSSSRTVFNRSIQDDMNMRVFEALACGSLLVTNRLSTESGQDEFFRDGVHLATYDESNELLDKLRFYLGRSEARNRVEQAGRMEAVSKHTYRHRMECILEMANRLPQSVPINSSAEPNSSLKHQARRKVSDAGFDPSYFEFDRPELLALIPLAARDVVDVGCGAGRLGASIKARQACQVVGIEMNPAAAAAARTRLDLVVEGDAENLDWPFPSASFDVVICGDVLEHMRTPLAFLRRVRQWLRPQGLLVASIPNVRHHSVVRGLLEGDWTYEPAGLLDYTHLRFFTRREVEKLLFRAGFDVPALIPVPGPGFAEWEAAGRPAQVVVGGLQIGPLPPAQAREFYTYQWLAAARPAETPAYSLTSIVILTHNQLPLTRRCVESIRLRTDEPYELVFVDNGSSDGTADYLRMLAALDERVTVILNPDNRGFPSGSNQGIKAARGEQVVLLNNDTVTTTGWLRRMLNVLHTESTVGLVGPCSNRVSSEQQVPVTYEKDLVGLDGFAWEWGRSHDRVIEETERLIGFCLLIKKAVIDRVGMLDEGFGIGNFEDDDFGLRARQAGFKTVIARDAFIHHVGGATFAASGVDYAALLQKNAERFQSKWGNVEAKSTAVVPVPVGPPVPSPSQHPDKRAFTIRVANEGGLLLERSRLQVSGCLIVRDNAGTIRACLGSLRPWVDELVVVDTGSKDDTPKIAEALGARVFHFQWIDDFAAARNESVRHALGEWIFWMDSDDVIDETNGRGLRDLVRGKHSDKVFGYVMRVHCPGSGPDGANDMTVVDHVKLFRNRPNLRFEHRIHEQIIPAIRRAGGDVAWTDLFVVHAGYDHSPEGQVRKKERDLRLLHRELEERPRHPFTLFNLGMTYSDCGEANRAAGYLEESLRNSQVGESQRRKAFALLTYCRQQLGDLKGALAVCEKGLAECPDDLELRFRYGVVLHHSGRLDESVLAYQRVLGGSAERYFTSVDRGIGGFKAHQNLAVIYAEQGHLDRAEAEWRAVTNEAPSHRLGWRGLGDVLIGRGKIEEAIRLATQLSANPRLAIEGLLLVGQVAEVRRQHNETRRAWEAAAAADPSDPEPLQRLARLYFREESELAERVLRTLTRVAPDDASAYHNLGTVLLRTNQASEAVRAFQRSLELRPGSIETSLCLGYALQSANDPVGAASAWQAVLAAQPNHPEASGALRQLRVV